jgi:hypothetical protein
MIGRFERNRCRVGLKSASGSKTEVSGLARHVRFTLKPGRTQVEQISSEMRSRADIETASSRSVSQKRRSTNESDRGSAL